MKVEINKSDLAELERDLDRLEPAAEAALLETAKDVKNAWRASLLAKGGYDSGDYYESIDEQVTDHKHVHVDSIGYAAIHELGRRDANYPGRFALRAALDWIDSSEIIETNLEREFNKTLK